MAQQQGCNGSVICPWKPASCRTKLYLMSLVRGNPPSAGQISVDDPAHLRRLPTAGNSVKLIDRVNGSATRLPRQCDLSVETHLLPDKVVFDVTCPWNPTFYRTKCSCSVYRYGWQKRYGLQQGCPREDLPPSALEGGACEAGGPGPHGGFLLPDVIAFVRHD